MKVKGNGGKPTKPVAGTGHVLTDDLEQQLLRKMDFSIFDWDPQDANGFSQKSTRIFIKQGEEADIVLIPHYETGEPTTQPYIASMHQLMLKTRSGKTYFPMELCIADIEMEGKPTGHCPLCDLAKTNDAVKPARMTLFYLVLDLRGSWDNEKGAFDGEPKIGFLQVPWQVHKQIKTLKEEYGELNYYILKFKKDKFGTTVTVQLERQPDGSFRPRVWDKPVQTIPNFSEIWAVPRPLEDYERLVEFITGD